MFFANPWLIGLGMLGIAAPIAVHLMMRRQNKKLKVSSLYLIEECFRVSKRRRRIKGWPLFLLRLLSVILLALLFGKPLLEHSGASEDKEAVVYILDSSASMQAGHKGKTAWLEGKRYLLDRLKDKSRAKELCAFRTGWWKDKSRWMSPAKIIDEVRAWEPRNVHDEMGVSIKRGITMLAKYSDDVPKVIHIISDLQKSSLVGIEDIELPSSITIKVTKVGEEKVRNGGLMTSYYGSGALRQGVYSKRGEAGEEVVYSEDGKKRELGQNDQIIRLPYIAPVRGWHTRSIALKIKDQFALDDIVYDAFYTQDEVNVMLVEPVKSKRPFDWKTFYVSRTLAPLAADLDVDKEKRLTKYLPRTVPTEKATQLIDKAAANSIVVMPDMEVSDELSKKLNTFVRGGGGLLLFGGAEINVERWNMLLEELSPVKIGEQEEVSGSRTVERITKNHLLWGELEFENRSLLRKLPIFKRHQLEPRSGVIVLASYNDGVPLIIERKVGKGRCIFVNTSADRKWSDWPAQGDLFVPTIHLISDRLLSSADVALRNTNVQLETFSRPKRLLVGAKHAGKTVNFKEKKYDVLPDGYLPAMNIEAVGLYPVQDKNDNILKIFAVNLPSKETDFAFSDALVFKKILEKQRVKSSEAKIKKSVNIENTDNNTLWKALLMAVLAVLIIEPFFANRS